MFFFFPSFSDNIFYELIIVSCNRFSLEFSLVVAYCNDIVVGAVCCRIDLTENRRRLYIMTLGVLAKYRELGLGTLMLEHVFKICEREGNIDSIYLYVRMTFHMSLSTFLLS